MSKMFKKCCVFVLAIALIFTSIAVAPDVSAAKKPKLSKKKVSIKVGGTYKLKVKKANKKAKVTWKISKKAKSIIKLSKKVKKGKKASVKITGKKAGKATIKAIYRVKGQKKRTLKCKVTVKPADSSAPAGAATTAPAGTGTTTPAGTTTNKPADGSTAAPTGATPTEEAKVTDAPTTKPTATPKVTATPTTKPTATPIPTQTPTAAPNTTVVNFKDNSLVTLPSDAAIVGNDVVYSSTGAGHDLVFKLSEEDIAKVYTKVTINYSINQGTFGFKYHTLGKPTANAQEDYVWENSSEYQFDSSAKSKTITFREDARPVDMVVLYDWYSSGSLTVNSVIFSDPLYPNGQGNPTDAPTSGPTNEPTNPPAGITDTELDPANLVTNGNFANGNTGWSSNFNTTINAVEIAGTHAGIVQGRWNSFSGPRTTITGSFAQGDVLTYQFSILRSNTLANYNNPFVIKFSEADTEHQSNPSSSSDGPGNAVGDADHWLTYYGTYTVQEATNSISVIVMENNYVAYGDDNPSANYVFYIDDLQIVQSAAPTADPSVTPTPIVADMEAGFTTDEITIDGVADAAWDSAAALPIAYYSSSTTSTTATAKVLWSGSKFYVLIDVNDSAIDYSNNNAWERDGVEVFFDEDLSRESSYGSNADAFQYRFTGLDGTSTTAMTNEFASSGSDASTRYAGREFAYTLTSTGYTVECSIPFFTAPAVDKVVGFEITVMDCEGGSRRNEIWLNGPNKGNMYQDPSLFGKVVLKDNGSVVAPTSAPTEEPTPTAEPTEEPLEDLSGPVDITTATANADGIVTITDGKLVINDTTANSDRQATDVYITLPGKVVPGERVQLTIKGSLDAVTSFRAWVGDGPNSGTVTPKAFTDHVSGTFEETFTLNIKSQETITTEDKIHGDMNVLTIKSPAWNGPALTGITIDSVDIVYLDRHEGAPTPEPLPDLSGPLDLTAFTTENNAATLVDGKIVIEDPRGDTSATVVYIPLPGTVASGETVTVVLKGTSEGDCDRFRVWIGNGPNNYSVTPAQLTEIPSGDFERTFTLKEDGTATNGACNMLTIKSTNWDGPAIKGITITSVDIYFTERGAVVPTAAPVVTPTPEPTPTAEPTEEPTTAPNFTATTSMEAGEKYLILFNDTAVNQSTNLYYENVGILYALTNTTSATAMTFDSEITDDRSGITVDLDSVLNAVWSCEAYEGSTTQFTLKNVGSGKYLRNNNGTLDFADSIAQNCAWTYTARTGEGYSYNCLLSVTDNTKFVRISNGSAVFKFGSTTSSTDGRNANAYLYKYRSDLFSVPTDPSDEGWVPGWY